jgi:hypothetical protein
MELSVTKPTVEEHAMSIPDLEAIVDRALIDAQFRRVVSHWSEALNADYALSADEIDALYASDYEALVMLGLDEMRAQLAARLS